MKKPNFTSIYMKKSLKRLLDALKVSDSESYESVIERLYKNRTFNIINGNVVWNNRHSMSVEVKK